MKLGMQSNVNLVTLIFSTAFSPVSLSKWKFQNMMKACNLYGMFFLKIIFIACFFSS